MAYLTKDQVKQVIEKRPENTTPQDVVNGLLQRGHQLEGLNLPKQQTDKEVDTKNQTDKKSFWNKVGDVAKFIFMPALAGGTAVTHEMAKGSAKGVGNTLLGAGRLGAKVLNKLSGEEQLQQQTQDLASNIKTNFLTPENTEQKIGYGDEQLAEFLLPGSASTKLGKIAEMAVNGGKVVKTLAKVGTKALTEGTLVSGQTTLQEGEVNNKSVLNGIIGAMFPVVGAGLSKGQSILKPIGEKIQQSVIRPNAKDLADGFNVENLTKYGVGGSLKETVAKVHTKINELIGELNTKLQGANPEVNLVNVFKQTYQDLMSNKTKQFGDNLAISRVFKHLKSEIDNVSDNGLVNLIDATNIKRGAGSKGAWSFGRMEPDANATEAVYTTFYNKLKTAIEESAPEGVKDVNKKISELIPISNAALRRLPVEQRNNIISLTDSIGLFSAMFDPKALALIGANKLSQSGKFGRFLVNLANKTPKSTIGKRILN